MIVPLFFWGISSLYLIYLWKIDVREYERDIALFVLGYAFATCNYLATNTELLSMSSMFIISAIAAISINTRFVNQFAFSKVGVIGCVGVLIIFLLSLFILRMTYMWGMRSVFDNKVRIDNGVAKGIYTSLENANEYYSVKEILDSASITDTDNVLIIPTNALYYLMLDGAVSSPYVVRFETNLNELEAYYRIHSYKAPDVVIIFSKGEKHNDIMEYFLERDYHICSDLKYGMVIKR